MHGRGRKISRFNFEDTRRMEKQASMAKYEWIDSHGSSGMASNGSLPEPGTIENGEPREAKLNASMWLQRFDVSLVPFARKKLAIIQMERRINFRN